MLLLKKLTVLDNKERERRKRLSRTFTSGCITCRRRQPSPVQFAHFFFCVPSHNRPHNIFYSNYVITESNFFYGTVGGRGQKDSHDKSIGKGGPVPCSWQSSLWVMLLKKMDNRSSPEGRPAALAPHSWDIPSPSLKPSVNTSLFQKCVGPSGFGLSPSLRSNFPSVAFSLWCMRWTCPTPQRPESSTSAGV